MPSEILLLRHAEKPDDKDDRGLSFQGRVRAAALSVNVPATFGPPKHLFAAKASKESNRPVLTVEPLAAALRCEIDTRFEHDAYEQLAHELLNQPKYETGRILICWHHGDLPELAKALGVPHAPDHWGDEVFDHIWQIDFTGQSPTLSKIHQKLLYGDQD